MRYLKKYKSCITILICVLTALFLNTTVNARSFDIVAVVNDNVITNHQMQERITIILGSAGIKDTSATRASVALQTIETLIDERLQKQEAERLKISLTQEEISKAIASIEAQNKLQPGQFDEFIKRHSIPKEAFMEQIKAQLLWQKMIIKLLQPKIQVSKSDIDEFNYKLSAAQGKSDLMLSEILIPVQEEKQEDDARKLAIQLVEEIRSGKDFSAFAKQFSRSNTAENGGKIGWIPETDLDSNIQEAIKVVDVGGVTEPIRNANGYLIMRVDERKERTADQVNLPDEEKVREFLFRKKLELEARKFIKNLRRNAYIERRV